MTATPRRRRFLFGWPSSVDSLPPRRPALLHSCLFWVSGARKFRDGSCRAANADHLCPLDTLLKIEIGFSLCLGVFARDCFKPMAKTRRSDTHFFINSSTAVVIALIPVRRVGSGSGSNKLECRDGRGFPDFLLASTLDGSIAPSQNMKAGI